MRVLITGSDGFIGSRLRPDGDLMRLDIKRGGDILDASNGEEIRKFDPHVVYHLAAHHYIPWCDRHPDQTHDTNAIGTALVLQACGPSLEAFVLASSAAVYGFQNNPIAEDAVLAGTSVYARSKRLAETALLQHAGRHPTVRCVAARLFNVAGAGDTWPHVIPQIVQHRDAELHLGNTWPLRDYVHVDDVADALQFLAGAAPAGFSEWNVGTGVPTSVTMLVRMVAQRAGAEIKMVQTESQRRSDDGHLVADVSGTAALGWAATRTLTSAIDEVLHAES
jgi:UDP-glucose 4-epimerase